MAKVCIRVHAHWKTVQCQKPDTKTRRKQNDDYNMDERLVAMVVMIMTILMMVVVVEVKLMWNDYVDFVVTRTSKSVW